MLVKIVNLSDNRFKNCRCNNFNNENVYFGIHSRKGSSEIAGAVKKVVKHVVEESEHDRSIREGIERDLERIRREGRDDTPEPDHRPGMPVSD